MKQIGPLSVALFAVLTVVAFTCHGDEAQAESGAPMPADHLRKAWGIEVASVRVSAGGSMIDFRYKVLDPDKAAPLGRREDRPYLIDQATGRNLFVPSFPKVGSLRQTAVKLTPGRVYGIMFANPAKTVKAGSNVTVVIGQFRLENLRVE